MKISAAFSNAFRVYFRHFGASLKFLVTEACITMIALSPLLFLTGDGLHTLALLAVPFSLALIPWARVNAAGAMQDALNGGSLFSMRLADPTAYLKKLLYGLSRIGLLLIWASPLIAALIVAKVHISGDMDGFTLLRMVRDFGGGDLVTGVLDLALILIALIILVTVGCAFHSGDRHALVRENPKLVKGHHEKIVLCWYLAALTCLSPLIISLVILVFRYLPALADLSAVLLTKTKTLPSTTVSLIILATGAVLTLPLLPLRSLITAALVDGLEKE